MTINNGCASDVSAAAVDTYGSAVFSQGMLRILNSHFESNSGDGTILSFGSSAEVIIVNSSLVSNGGGAAAFAQSSAMTLVNTTIAEQVGYGLIGALGSTVNVINTTIHGGSSIAVNNVSSTITLHNSILANEGAGDCSGDAVTHANSYSDDATCGFGAGDNTVFHLGALTTASNGTQYYPLAQIGSPVDGGDNSLLPTESQLGLDVDGDGSITATQIDVDQRADTSQPRILSGTVDAGAHETLCSAFTASYTLTQAGGQALVDELRDAMSCYGVDTIDLADKTVSFTDSFADYSGATALPGITANLSLSNGTVNKSSGDFRFLYVDGTGTLNLDNVTLQNGGASSIDGGGIYVETGGTLKLFDSTFTDLTANYGGGVYVNTSATLELLDSTFTNITADRAGAIWSYGTVTIANSTFDTNSVTNNGGAIVGSADSTMNIVNSTFVDNQAGGRGGAIHSESSTSTINLYNSTIAGNSSTNTGGGINISQGAMNIYNTIISGNAATSGNDECGGTLSSSTARYNVFGQSSSNGGCTGFATSTSNITPSGDLSTILETSAGDPVLDNNGGRTKTIALTGGSPAIQAGSNSYLPDEGTLGIDLDGDGIDNPIDVDQRGAGFARISFTFVDIGAYETSGCEPYASPYTVGIVNSDLAADLQAAVECANSTAADEIIDLDGQTVTFSHAPASYDSWGYNALPLILLAGTLTIENGVIERDSSLSTCTAGDNDRTKFRFIAVNDGKVTLDGLTFRNGCSYSGKGGAVNGTGDITIRNSSFDGNTADDFGGALYAIGGSVKIVGSSFVNNESGSWTIGTQGADIVILNSTMSNNAVSSRSQVNSRYDSEVTIINSTISGNTGSGVSVDSHLNVFNTIISNNTGSNCTFYSGTSSLSHSYSDDASCGFASNNGADNATISLGPLITHTNGTQYYPLLGGDPLNGGSNALLPDESALGIDIDGDSIVDDPIDVDQIGDARIVDTTVDAGAHESVCTAGPFTIPAGDEQDLVKAITCANDETINPGADVITLTTSTYTFDGILATVDGNNGLPDITSEIIINGNNSTIQRDSSSLYSFRLFHVAVAGKLTLNQVTVQNGLLSGGSFGPPQDGGGIFNRGTVTLTNSTLANNSADIANGGYGGGLSNAGTVFIENSTIRDNQAAGYGGGLANGLNNVISMTNSTLSGNTTTGSYGGGIYNQGTFTISHGTIVSNTSSSQGGGIYTDSGKNTIVTNSIIAHNSQDCGGSGTLAASGTNIDFDGQCASSAGSNFITTDPFIIPLQDNGGDTWTHALAFNSPAIDAGGSADCTAADQRGESRTDWLCDIGANELMFSDSDTVSKTVSTGVTVSFGGTLVKATVVNDGGCLTGITVQRVPGNHPSALTNIQTGRYWTITPTPLGCSGFDVTLTLPYDVTSSSRDKACRYTGSGWDCGTDGENTPSTSGPAAMPNIVTRTIISQFSDWAVGAEVGPTAVSLQSLNAVSGTSWGMIGLVLLLAATAVVVLTYKRRYTKLY